MPALSLILSKLRTRYLIALLIGVIIVLLILIISVSGGSDTTLSNKKQEQENKTKTFDGEEGVREDTLKTYYQLSKVNNKGDNIQDTTEQIKFLLETRKKPVDNFFAIEDDINIMPVGLQSGETKSTESLQTTQKTTLAVRLLIEHQTENRTNEGQAGTKKFSSSLEARKAYVALHGRSVSETKCVEYETLHCELERRKNAALAEFFKRPHPPGQVDGVGIGGRETGAGEYPHMGALGWLDTARNWTFMCGSSLISRNFVLTAAHCSWVSPRQFNLIDPKPQIVRLGNKNLLEVNPKYYLDVKIQEIIVHPAYKSPLKYSDIALMKLTKDVVFDLYMMPACLWRDATVEPGTEVDGTGWGYTSVAVKNMSAELQVVNINIIDSNQCDGIVKVARSRNFKGVRSHQICAGVLEGGVDTCQGDSGGPIQIKEPHICVTEYPLSTVIGVTSFGFGCARAGMPSVYTRVSSYIDWIEENVWKQELHL